MAKQARITQGKKANVMRKFRSKLAYTKIVEIQGIKVRVTFYDDLENGWNYCLYDDQILFNKLGLQKAAKADILLNKKLTKIMKVNRLINAA